MKRTLASSRDWIDLENENAPLLDVEQVIGRAVEGIGVAAKYWSRRAMTDRAGEMVENLAVAEQELAAARKALREWRLSVMANKHPNGRMDG
jgi:hypothetical protein